MNKYIIRVTQITVNIEGNIQCKNLPELFTF